MEEMSHREAKELLPWLAQDSLGDDERRRLFNHLQDCTQCRQELLYVSDLRAALDVVSSQAGAETVDPRSPRVGVEAEQRLQSDLNAVLRRIDHDSKSPFETTGPKPRSLFAALSSARRLFAGAPLRWAAATLLVAIVALVWMPLGRPDPTRPTAPPSFEVLSDPVSKVAGDADSLRLGVVFEAQAPMSRVQELILRVDGEVVAGPSRMGVFDLRLNAGAEGGDAQARALEILRGAPEVIFAEPKNPSSSGLSAKRP